MKLVEETLHLPEGAFQAEVYEYETSDRRVLKEIYDEWRSLSTKLIDIGSRAVNIPEGLSEGAFSLETGAVRVSNVLKKSKGVNTSFDCYNLKTQKRIQVKACGRIPDVTTFGPKSQWDELYFCDFYREGKWDGTFDIYLIENDLIYDQKVNVKETMKDQQSKKRRPRFSIYTKLIIKNGIKPVITGKI